jgi:hypothetical protein
MDLFLDCEWSDVLASELVSIAIVSMDGQRNFYAERDPLPRDPTPWVRTVVYPLLDRGTSAMTDASMTHALREFLTGTDRPRIFYDFGADRGLCQYVIDGFEIPNPAGPLPADLRWQLCNDVSHALEKWWLAHPEEKQRRHHALADAQALRGAYLSLQRV